MDFRRMVAGLCVSLLIFVAAIGVPQLAAAQSTGNSGSNSLFSELLSELSSLIQKLNFALTIPVSQNQLANLSGIFPDGGGLSDYWAFDDAAGTTAIDSENNNNNGMLQGGTTWTNGKVNGALNFDGSTGYVSVPENSAFEFGSNSFSIATWFKTSANSFGHLISDEKTPGSPGWRLVINGGQIQFRMSDGSTQIGSTNSPAENNGAWHYAAVVVDRSANFIHLYIDGTEMTPAVSIASLGPVTDAGAQLDFGATQNNGTPIQFFSGVLDETRFYNRALSASEVAQAMNDPGLTATAPPTITSFSANPSSISNGQSTVLSWSTSGATSVSIDNSLGAQTSIASGSVTASPTQNTTYTLSASNANGTTTAQSTVLVSNGLSLVIPPPIGIAGPAGTLATFTVPEDFGINYQDQIIDFNYSGPYYSNMYMLDPNGNQIPFQKLSNGDIAVRTTLNANTTQTFTLKSGQNPTASYPDQVSLAQSGNYYQITNGITGVRVLNGALVPSNQMDLAPIQGIEMEDGTWSPAGTIIDGVSASNEVEGPLNATSISTSIVENGPLEVILKVTYSYILSSPLMDGSELLIPAGPGYYTSTITMQAGQQSIMIEDATDMNLDYKINLYPDVQPTVGEYAGPGASNALYGYEPNQPGIAYTGVGNSQTGWHDGFRNFDYSTAVTLSYQATPSSVPYASPWSLWELNTGYYWMLYNQAAGSNAPVVGAFIASPSRALGVAATGFGPYVIPGSGSSTAGFEFQSARRAADNEIDVSTRYDWGIFVGTKGNDLANPYDLQNINKQMNLHGFFNLNKIYQYQLTFPDPTGGYGRLYMDPSVVQGIITKLRAGGAAATAYYNYLIGAGGSGAAPLINMWADPTGATTHAEVLSIASLVKGFLNTYVNGHGVFNIGVAYWEGGGTLAQQLPYIDAALADPTLTPQDKASLKQSASAIAYILYDDDYVPMDTFFSQNPLSGISSGNLNMYTQQLGYRNQYALWMPQHPAVAAFASGAAASADQALHNLVAPDGATECSPHYTQPCIEPTIETLLEAKEAGTNYFASDQPFMDNLGNFLMQWLTPPDVRYKVSVSQYYPIAVPRKDVEEGDGQTESHAYDALMATGLQTSNPTLAAQLMGAWIDSGKTEDDFAGTTISMINENAPSQDPNLTSANFPGYMSVLRSGWETPQENAYWLFNGDTLNADTGHRHDDRGDIVLYALETPLSLNWSSFYSPEADAGNMANIVMPDTSYSPVAWNADDQPVNSYNSGWISSTNDTFETFSDSAMANGEMVNSDGLDWERKLYSITADPSLPIIMIKDDFSGNTSGGKVMTLNLMATGTVMTPAGQVTPPIRFEENTAEVPADTFPSVSQTINLNTGVNQFIFTGQPMPQHPTNGISWDLYTISDENQQAIVGNWGDAEANESQDILRVHGSDGFWTIILPYDKGARPSNLSVTQDASGNAVISYSGKTIKTNEHYYSYTDGTKNILTSFDNSFVSGDNMTVSGGAMEIVQSGTSATIVFSGAPGIRTFSLPLSFASVSGISNNGSNYSYSYNGSNPITITVNGTLMPVTPSNLSNSNTPPVPNTNNVSSTNPLSTATSSLPTATTLQFNKNSSTTISSSTPLQPMPQTFQSSSTLSSAEISSILQQIQSLSLELFKVSNNNRPLSFESQGTDVWALQILLMLDGKGPASTALLQRGPTGVYGDLTISAVKEYQKSVGIVATGYFGPATRAALIGN